MRVYDLRCEGEARPLGIAETRPRLSWKIAAEGRGAGQSAYRVLAAREPADLTAGEDLLWDSGRVESGRSTQAP